MKRKSNLVVALAALMVSANVYADELKAVYAVDSNENEHYYYYNGQNQLIWEQYSTVRKVYSYDDNGNSVNMSMYSWVEADKQFKLTRIEDYTYDENGNLASNTWVKSPGTAFEGGGSYTYSDYVDGIATRWNEYGKSGDLFYLYKTEVKKDAAGKVVSRTDYYADPDKDPNDFSGVEAEYTYTYNPDGTLLTETKGKTSTTYTYAEVNAAYAPTNISATNNGGNVTFKWSEVAGAEKYILSYDLRRVEVNGTEYNATLAVGNHPFTVQAVIDGQVRNCATPSSVDVRDPGIKPVESFTIGEVTRVVEKIKADDGSTFEREFFYVPLQWTLAQEHSPIVSYNVYYNSTRYGKDYRVAIVELDGATEYLLKVDVDELAEWNEDGELTKGVDTPFTLSVVYTTGESELSEPIIINPYEDWKRSEEEKGADIDDDGEVTISDITELIRIYLEQE